MALSTEILFTQNIFLHAIVYAEFRIRVIRPPLTQAMKMQHIVQGRYAPRMTESLALKPSRSNGIQVPKACLDHALFFLGADVRLFS